MRIIKNVRVFAYWSFALVIGMSLIYLETLEDSEPLFSIATFIYFALLIFWGLQWIIAHTRFLYKQKRDKTNLELKHLQSQINPHFFFNTLNNLYGLVEKDSAKAQALILKLSDMMRYSIYEGQKESVTIKEEVEYLKNYISLHKMRYHKEIDVNFQEMIEDDSIKVFPLLFISILENAFKHGVENLRTDAYVHIKLATIDNSIYFEVENNFDTEEANKEEGIGIKNLERRLKLAYPKKHSYTNTKTKNVFKAQLKLQTS